MTLTDLCNEALDLTGASPISALNDGTIEADLCARSYPQVRDRVLREYPWNCAVMRAALTHIPGGLDGFTYELPDAPDHCLRVLEADDDCAVWSVEQLRDSGQLKRVLRSDRPVTRVRFIRRIEDPAEFDPLLAALIAAELAVRLAAKLTESAARMGELREHAAKLRLQARQTDALEAGVTTLRHSSDATGLRHSDGAF